MYEQTKAVSSNSLTETQKGNAKMPYINKMQFMTGS